MFKKYYGTLGLSKNGRCMTERFNVGDGYEAKVVESGYDTGMTSGEVSVTYWGCPLVTFTADMPYVREDGSVFSGWEVWCYCGDHVSGADYSTYWYSTIDDALRDTRPFAEDIVRCGYDLDHVFALVRQALNGRDWASLDGDYPEKED